MIVEQTSAAAADPPSDPDWDAIERSPAFRDLVAAKWRFTIPTIVVALAYYFALPILTGYAPHLMSTPVLGPVNLANLFALSQFVMVAIAISLYVTRARAWDERAREIIATASRAR